ncbi:uncharacterized protein HMPREF1541_08376 [Cyphellophora europaea CBS 101466]|uniref:Phospholipid metabolism enzyme regulator n=1 Tax=Cyphellophora europaea (strain CBS 101466) TaxID=1220924 RepID=W2RM72_CYPE1|nr:uncharacterized protein HMPREF1541_08376 [Cyphellophora europaea CBS 101466]ETN37385.1 hypothetical protein HMPREF1541_08376 [Cyphellophora europaea CBS 101466]
MPGDRDSNKGEAAPEASNPFTADHTKPREPSPLRASRSSSSIPQISRSRKNSQEFSPTRNTTLSGTLSTIPSAAAVQRALSAQRPVLQPGAGLEASSDSTRARPSGNNSPAWPTSPRLKSPPPSLASRQTLPKRSDNDHTPSNTSMKRLTNISASDDGGATHTPDNGKEQATSSQLALRPPGRGPSAASGGLEPVAEGSIPTTPSISPENKPLGDSKPEGSGLSQHSVSDASTVRNGDGNDLKAAASKAENDAKARVSSNSRTGANLAKRSLTSLTSAKAKAPDPPRTMTIETEPVTTTPQLLGTERLTGRDGSGSVRTKPSNETIRPKKEKKKATRKTPSLHSGTVTSKADIFEAKVASAVDEADTSDSDETFVYESNPPDSRSHRHHSRTPSATSLASTDHHGRNRHGMRSGSNAVGAKKSMKFSNYNNGLDEGEDGRSSIRNGSSHRPHHIGRHGKAAHSSILDSNSPFSQASKTNSPKASSANLAKFSRPNSPKVSNGRVASSPKKGDAFDIYDNPADDERTPLVGGSVRVNRNRHTRRSGLRNTDYFDETDGSICGRLGGCILIGLVVLIVCVGIVTFVIGLNQPLVDVKVRHLQNILASEQELMLDLHVDAINTNIFAISVNDLDVNIFAESSHVGSSSDYEKEKKNLRWATRIGETEDDDRTLPWPFPADGIDEGTDPIEEEPGTQKMLLGTILEFDSPLTFDASPLRRRRSTSVGEIRLAKPGNKTEVGGSARWERVLQHDFNLIVRGVIKYQVPLSSKIKSVKISSIATVHPNEDDGSKSHTSLDE